MICAIYHLQFMGWFPVCCSVYIDVSNVYFHISHCSLSDLHVLFFCLIHYFPKYFVTPKWWSCCWPWSPWMWWSAATTQVIVLLLEPQSWPCAAGALGLSQALSGANRGFLPETTFRRTTAFFFLSPSLTLLHPIESLRKAVCTI